MATIDLSNYATSLYQASSNAFTDGNVYFDTAAGTIEFGDATDHANLDLTAYSLGAAVPNPLIRLDGLRFEALYAFENQERRAEVRNPETLRGYDRFTKGTFKFGGAYEMINGRTFANDASRKLLRGSGWRELTGTTVNRIYFGFKGLGAIDAASVPYYQSGQYGGSTDFTKLGNLDEAIQVFGDAANGNFDDTGASYYVSVRTYGKNYDRIDTQGTLGIAELGGYSTGAALNESDHLTSGSYALADVYGGAQVTPWTGMTLEKINATFTTGAIFSGGTTGTFSWRLNNTNGGTLEECVAYLDAIAQADAVVTTGDAALNGKDYDVWYEYTPAGKIRPITGAGDGLGVFIDNLPVNDQTSVEFVDDGSNTRVYPINVPVTVELGAAALADFDVWIHCFNATGYNSGSATDYLDASDNPVKATGNGSQSLADTSSYVTGTAANWSHDFTGDGTTNVIFLCEGDGGATQAKTAFTIGENAVNTSCEPGTETNA